MPDSRAGPAVIGIERCPKPWKDARNSRSGWHAGCEGAAIVRAMFLGREGDDPMQRVQLTEKILDIKREKGWSWKYICGEIGGFSPILITAALLGRLRLLLCELHLAEQRRCDQHRGESADLAADVFPAPALLALDVEDLFGQLYALHGVVSFSSQEHGANDRRTLATGMPAGAGIPGVFPWFWAALNADDGRPRPRVGHLLIFCSANGEPPARP